VSNLQTFAYRLVRYTPDLVRDEWINCGVLFYAPGHTQVEARCLREDAEFARVHRLHPQADIALLRNLEAELMKRGSDSLGLLDEALSGLIQLGPQKAVLTSDPAVELARIYQDYVAPPRAVSRATLSVDAPSAIRKRASEILAGAGLHDVRSARAEQWTFAGDPMRIDFDIRGNGIRRFAQAVALNRDTAGVKALAFTSDRIRAKLPKAHFTAITESAPQPENARHCFARDLLADQRIDIVALANLPDWARQVAHAMH
jgi:hypothetical protein